MREPNEVAQRLALFFNWDDTLSEANKFEGLKWVDAINCRVIDAYDHPRSSMPEFHYALMAQSEHTGVLPTVVASAWHDAEKWVADHDT